MSHRTTREADEDIIGIYLDGYRGFGRMQAERYHDGLAAAFKLIAAYPYIGRERVEFHLPVRLHPYNAHIIVYRVMQDGLLIVRVLHARTNWQQLL